MALGHNTSIVRDGLVFYYDMGNTQKSWKGAPTTNITPDMNVGSVQASPTLSFIGVENGWKKYSIDGTWTSGTYPYSVATQSVPFTGGVTYSTGLFVRTNVPQKFATLFSGMNYVNEPMNNAGTSFSIPQSDGSFYVGRSGFQYANTVSQTGYLLSQPNIGQTFTAATDFIFIRNGQVEVGSFPTPYVNGTRSNTQAVVDLTNNNTVTANSLTYNANGTFSFNGSSDVLTIPNSSLLNPLTGLTIDSWVKFDTDSDDFIFEKGDVNTQYSLFSHGTDVVFRTYHSGDGSYHTQNPSKSDVGVVNGQWVNILASWDGSTKRIFINGDLKNSVAKSGNLVTTSLGASVGRFGGNTTGYYFNGSIASIKVYQKGLTATEVKQNFEALRDRYGI